MTGRQQHYLNLAKVLAKQHGCSEVTFGLMQKNAKRALGRYWLQRGYIDFNPHYLNNGPDELIVDTILHELAHHITWRDYKSNGHCRIWKSVCCSIGAKPTRCKTLPTGTLIGTERNARGYTHALVNSETGTVYKKYKRAPKNHDLSSTWIVGKKDETFGKLAVIKL